MRVVTRILTGVLAAGLLGGLTYGAGVLEPPQPRPVEPGSVTLAPASSGLLCPGPAQLADPDTTQDPAFDPTPVDTQATVSAVVRAPSVPAPAPVRSLDGQDAVELTDGPGAAVGQTGREGAAALWTEPGPDGVVLAAATAASLTAEGDLRGLAAMSCTSPAAEQWLIGGSTVVGTSTRLVLQNAARTPAAVTIEVWGATGLLELDGPSTFSVPAGGQTATLLEALVPDQRRVAVRVVSTGALISSYLQVNELDGFVPVGVDFVSPSDGPAMRQVVTGLTVEATEVGDVAGPWLRLVAPSGESTTVSLTVLTEDGRVPMPGADEVELDGAGVADVSLSGLPAGTYSVVAESDGVPVVASAGFTRAGQADADGERDVAFVAARSGVEPADESTEGDLGTVAIPSGARPVLSFVALPADLAEAPWSSGTGEAVPDDDPETDEAEDPAAGEPGAEDETEDGAAPPGPAAEVEVTLLDRDGRVIGTYPVDILSGTTTRFDPASAAPEADVAGVWVTRTTAGSPASETEVLWNAVVGAGADDELVSVLQPVPALQTREQVLLRPGLSVGVSR